MTLALCARFDDTDATLDINFTFPNNDAAEPPWEAMIEGATAQGSVQVKDLPSDQGPRDNHASPAMSALARCLGPTRRLRLVAQTLAAPSYNESDDETPRLGSGGSGLASVLADMAGRAPDDFEAIQAAVRAIVPTLERIRWRPAKVYLTERESILFGQTQISSPRERWVWGHQLVLDFAGAPDILAPLASEGTLLAIGLMTALHAKPRPRLLLLDDLDQALHPRAQRELIAQLRAVIDSRRDIQIVATSHSPYLLDQFEAQEVVLTAVRHTGPAAGSTACTTLSEHPDLERWKDVARTGELWSFVGEDWVLEQAKIRDAS